MSYLDRFRLSFVDPLSPQVWDYEKLKQQADTEIKPWSSLSVNRKSIVVIVWGGHSARRKYRLRTRYKS
jgi:hypothetical protein